MVIEQVKRGKSRNPGQGGRTGKSRTGVQMSKPVKKKTRTRKSLGRGSRWQKGTLAGIQNRDAQTSVFLVLGQGRSWAGASGTGKKGESRGDHRVGGTQVGFFNWSQNSSGC